MSDAAVVTFLFTDLVGSTEMLDRLGDDVAEQVRRTHFRLLRDAVTGAGGEEVKNLGDGLMVAFTSALAAVRCATAMQRAVARHNAGEHEAVLDVRIGLHVGEPIRDEDDYFGASVVVAKRLCDRAHGGQVVASDLLRGLVGSRGGFEFVSLGPLELKGLSEAVVAFEVAWQAPVRTERVRLLPSGLDQPTLARYVGRVSERDELMEAWKVAVAGATKLVMVAGEPGVGKTRLVAEVARSVYDDGGVVLFGRCTEEALMPYQPFVEALRDHAAGSSTMELADETRVGATQLARFVPDLGARLGVSDPDLRADPQSERFLLFEAVGGWLDAIAARAAGAVSDLRPTQQCPAKQLTHQRIPPRSPNHNAVCPRHRPARMLAAGVSSAPFHQHPATASRDRHMAGALQHPRRNHSDFMRGRTPLEILDTHRKTKAA